jgi:hypothetical protein
VAGGQDPESEEDEDHDRDAQHPAR